MSANPPPFLFIGIGGEGGEAVAFYHIYFFSWEYHELYGTGSRQFSHAQRRNCNHNSIC